MKPSSTSEGDTFEVSAYSVQVRPGAELDSWKTSSREPLRLSSENVKLLPEGVQSSSLFTQISATPAVPADHKQLVPMIKSGLQEGLAAACSRINDTKMRVTIADIKVEGVPPVTRRKLGSSTHQTAQLQVRPSFLWVVYW
jgi:hypothetical protein